MSFLTFKKNRFWPQLEYVCDTSPISFLTLLTGALLLATTGREMAFCHGINMLVTLEIPVLTQGLCWQRMEHILWKPHTAQLVNHPESHFYLNANETSEKKSKRFLKITVESAQTSKRNKLGKLRQTSVFLHLGSQSFLPFLFIYLFLTGGKEDLCLYPGWLQNIE